MINRVGLAAAIENNPPSSTSKNGRGGGGGSSFSLGVVSEIILTHTQTSNPNLNPGGINSLGAIRCSNIGNDLIYPLQPNLKFIPTLGEAVVVVSLDASSLNQNSPITPYIPQQYYISPLNMFGHPFLNKPLGVAVKEEWNIVFDESLRIHRLVPQPGDVLIEGKFGNSIRLSCTMDTYQVTRPLSWKRGYPEGKNNDPIIVFRNGQDPNILQFNDPTIPTQEEINDDLSSIYMTSYQNVDITTSREKHPRNLAFISFTEVPITPSKFGKPQIIGNADRILLNAKTDSILLSAQKSVGLMSNESINLESEQVVIHSRDLNLGSYNATESVLYGDKTIDNLKSLVNILRVLVTSTIGTDPKYSAQSTSFITTLDLIDTEFNNCKSENVKVD